MKFELLSKSDNEVIDVLEMNDIDIKGAKAYFMARKMLEEKDFDKMFKLKLIHLSVDINGGKKKAPS